MPLIASEAPLDCVPHQAHAWALSEYLAAGLGDARIADLSYGQLKDFLTVSGKCSPWRPTAANYCMQVLTTAPPFPHRQVLARGA